MEVVKILVVRVSWFCCLLISGAIINVSTHLAHRGPRLCRCFNCGGLHVFVDALGLLSVLFVSLCSCVARCCCKLHPVLIVFVLPDSLHTLWMEYIRTLSRDVGPRVSGFIAQISGFQTFYVQVTSSRIPRYTSIPVLAENGPYNKCCLITLCMEIFSFLEDLYSFSLLMRE